MSKAEKLGEVFALPETSARVYRDAKESYEITDGNNITFDPGVEVRALEAFGLTPDIVAKVDNCKKAIVEGVEYAIGEIAIDEAKKAKTPSTSYAGAIKIGRDKLEVVFTPKLEATADSPVEYGDILSTYNVGAIRGTNLKKGRQHLRELAAQAFGSQ